MIEASARKPLVVHSSFGRLRVHWPARQDHLIAQLRLVPGVTQAEANAWTGNVLILFRPSQVNQQSLLAKCQALTAKVPDVAASAQTSLVLPTRSDLLPASSGEESGIEQDLPVYVTGLRRKIYQFLGWANVGLAFIGAILPGIPTVPFVILAGYFFMRSSPEAHRWLLRSWFGPMLRDWEKWHAVRRPVKYTAVGMIVVAMMIVVLIGLPTPLVVTILALEIIGLILVLRLPVIEAESSALVPAAA